jgi:hypothetical protein
MGKVPGCASCFSPIAGKHGVPISAVATRYVLDIPSVKAMIVGSRLNDRTVIYAQSNLLAFSFRLDDEDRKLIADTQQGLDYVPGDYGDEYRRAPYLTASCGLSHHFDGTTAGKVVQEAIAQGKRVEYVSGSKLEPIAISNLP